MVHLAAADHAELRDPVKVHEGRIRDLAAVANVGRVDPTQMHKGRVRDGCLVA